MQCRLIVDPPAPGVWNMAVDESLLDSADRQGAATLRLYSWQEPTLSLGYFQRYADRHAHEPSRRCAVVRRPSGGGAILHDRELTYCLTLPASAALRRNPRTVYRAIHQAAAAALACWGLRAVPCGGAPVGGGEAAAERSAFLCFRRYSDDDLIVMSQAPPEPAGASLVALKVLGSAQRRRHGALLQHGSLILARSPYAPEIAGLAEALGHDVDADELRAAWIDEIAVALGCQMRPEQLTAEEWRAAESLVSGKYATPQWTQRK
jgi:lipoate-protein ligase A